MLVTDYANQTARSASCIRADEPKKICNFEYKLYIFICMRHIELQICDSCTEVRTKRINIISYPYLSESEISKVIQEDIETFIPTFTLTNPGSPSISTKLDLKKSGHKKESDSRKFPPDIY